MGLPRVRLRPELPAGHDMNGCTALNGRPRGTVGRGAGCRYGGWISTRSSLRSRAVASVGYRAEHAALARYLALVVNELITAGALPPNGRATELGS